MAKRLAIEVVDIQGQCPVYEIGDRYRIEEGYKLVAGQPICMHALQSICPYYVALSHGIDPAELGLGRPDGSALCSAWTRSGIQVAVLSRSGSRRFEKRQSNSWLDSHTLSGSAIAKQNAPSVSPG